MHSPDVKAPALAVWALGLTQIIGYGTLYYSFAILAPAMSTELGLPEQWVFGALSAALFLGSLLAPMAGRLADRHGAGRVMTAGSVAAAFALAACALAPDRIAFVGALVAMELASCFVLYATAFVAIVQIGPVGAQRSITHLTLIAGFASTLFWPLTTALHSQLSWREIYLVFATLNLVLCAPVHAWLTTLSRRHRLAAAEARQAAPAAAAERPANLGTHRTIFLLMMAGFAVEGFILSAILIHMVPLTQALGLGATGVVVTALFGPSQVASRFVNLVFGGRLKQAALALISTLFVAAGLAVLLIAAPALSGIAMFVVLFGLGSGLISIVGGTLPLEVFGSAGYGGSIGWMSAARQFSSSFAPFVFAVTMTKTTVPMSLGLLLLLAGGGVAIFGAIAVIQRRTYLQSAA